LEALPTTLLFYAWRDLKEKFYVQYFEEREESVKVRVWTIFSAKVTLQCIYRFSDPENTLYVKQCPANSRQFE
jgi:hypothetical protein